MPVSILTSVPLFLLNYRLLLTLQTTKAATLSPSTILSVPIIYTCLLIAYELNVWGSNSTPLYCLLCIPYLNISLAITLRLVKPALKNLLTVMDEGPKAVAEMAIHKAKEKAIRAVAYGGLVCLEVVVPGAVAATERVENTIKRSDTLTTVSSLDSFGTDDSGERRQSMEEEYCGGDADGYGDDGEVDEPEATPVVVRLSPSASASAPTPPPRAAVKTSKFSPPARRPPPPGPSRAEEMRESLRQARAEVEDVSRSSSRRRARRSDGPSRRSPPPSVTTPPPRRAGQRRTPPSSSSSRSSLPPLGGALSPQSATPPLRRRASAKRNNLQNLPPSPPSTAVASSSSQKKKYALHRSGRTSVLSPSAQSRVRSSGLRMQALKRRSAGPGLSVSPARNGGGKGMLTGDRRVRLRDMLLDDEVNHF